MSLVAWFCIGFNLIDALSTIFMVKNGLAVEVNPFMAALLSRGSVLFFFGKMILACAGIIFLDYHKNIYWSRAAMFVIFAVYFLLVVYQGSLFVNNRVEVWEAVRKVF